MSTELDKIEFLIGRYEELIERKADLNIKMIELSKLISSYGEADIESKKESLSLINEYAEMLSEIKSEIDSFDLNRINQFKDYFAIRARYNMLSKEIQTAEKLSLKSNGNKSKTVNAEGRDKMIDDDLLVEYQSLIAQKIVASKQMRYFYNIIKSINIDEVKKEVNNEKEEPILSPITIPYEEKEVEFSDLPLDIQIKETQDRIDRILSYAKTPGLGKKRIIEYNGEKIILPTSLYGQFSQSRRTLEKLMKQQKSVVEPLEVTQFPSDLVQSPIGITEETNKDFVSSEVINLPEVQKEKIQEIQGIKEPKSKKTIKEKIKKAIVVIITAAIVFTSGSAISKLFKSRNNDTPVVAFPQSYSTSTVGENNAGDNYQTSPLFDSDISFDNEKLVTPIETNEQEGEEEYELGDIVSIDVSKPIYSKMEDACNETNPLEHYYKDNDDRVIEAITLVTKSPEGEDVYHTIWNFDPKANEKIEFLRQNGAETKGVVVTKASLSGQNLGYEGFKNINDIQKAIIKGRSI